MPSIYSYPTTNELELIEQKLIPRLTQDSPVFRFMPLDSANENLLMWDQKDNFQGLQQMRGWNGQPPSVNRISANRYIAEPGVYGEKIPLDERELTNRRPYGTLGGAPIAISDMVGECQEQLLNRRINRIETILWNLLINGQFTVSNTTGGVSYGGSYTQQKFTPPIPWSNPTTSTPLADLRNLRAFEAGQSVSFGTGATIIGQWSTINMLLNNVNPSDLGGKREAYGETYNDLAMVNKFILSNDLPPVEIYNGGYIDDNGNWNYFIPSGFLLVVGKRTTGMRMGFYRFTRNVNSPNAAAAPYTRVIDHSQWGVPSMVEVHDGHNGGPVLQFPGSAVLMQVA